MKARLAILATLLLAAASYGCIYPKCKPNIDCIEIVHRFGEIIDEKDSVKCHADSIKIASNAIAKINDSLKQFIYENTTAKTMVNSHEFYRDAFSQIQNVFMFFLAIIGGLTGYSAFKVNSYDKKISKLELDIKKQSNYLDLNKASLFREIGTMYFSLAVAHLKQKDWMVHLKYLTQHYDFLMTYKIELLDKDLVCLKLLYVDFIKAYLEMPNVDYLFPEYSKQYLDTLERFKLYCEETDNQKHFAEAKKAHKVLSDFFGPMNQKIQSTGNPS
jgi:hypothetical protein